MFSDTPLGSESDSDWSWVPHTYLSQWTGGSTNKNRYKHTRTLTHTHINTHTHTHSGAHRHMYNPTWSKTPWGGYDEDMTWAKTPKTELTPSDWAMLDISKRGFNSKKRRRRSSRKFCFLTELSGGIWKLLIFLKQIWLLHTWFQTF